MQDGNTNNHRSSEHHNVIGYCKYDVCRRCYHPDSGCSFLSGLGVVLPCKYLPNSDGRFSICKRGSSGFVSPAVLSPVKYVKRRVF